MRVPPAVKLEGNFDAAGGSFREAEVKSEEGNGCRSGGRGEW